MSQCSDVQVSSQVNVELDGEPQNFSGDFTARVTQSLGSSETISVPPGASAVPIGPVPSNALAFLYVKNLDPALVLELSTNANGLAPFASLTAGQHAVIPTAPGAIYYFFNPASAAIAAQVLALSS